MTTPTAARHGPVAVGARPDLLIGLGVAGLAGCLSLTIGTLVGAMVVPGHDWMAETISNFGAGAAHRTMDFALFGFAGGLVAVAPGAAHVHLGGGGWTLGIVCLLLLAGSVLLVGARDEYGDGDSGGIVIHIYLVYALGVLFAAAPLLMARGAAVAGAGFRIAFRVLAALWILAAPAFFVVPSGLDGPWERALGVIAMGWVVALSLALIRVARRGGV